MNYEGIIYKIGNSKYEYGWSKFWKKFKPSWETLDLLVLECFKGQNKFEHDYVVFSLGYVDD